MPNAWNASPPFRIPATPKMASCLRGSKADFPADDVNLPKAPTPLGFVVLSPSDVVYVAGNFNGWCANCNALEDPDGDFVWKTTLELPLGNTNFNTWSTGGVGP